MVECPHCNEKIDRVVDKEVRIFRLNSYGNLERRYPGAQGGFTCPKCEGLIAQSNEKAKEFLKGGN